MSELSEILWIKISTKMFDDEKIKLIDSMPERDTIFNIWIKLLVQAGKNNAAGYIFLNENIPYTEEMLSTIFNRPLNSLRLALQTLKNFGMIDISENHLIKISNWGKHQNIDGMEKIREQNRLRKQKQREREKVLILGVEKDSNCIEEANSHVTSCDGHAIEEDKEEDKEIEDISTTAIFKEEKDYIGFFNRNFYSITNYENDDLKKYENDGISAEVITVALKQAVECNKKNMGYVKTILDRWKKYNILTLDAVIEDKKLFKAKKSNKQSKKQSRIDNFTNFQQRSYDFDSLEKKLLGWDKT